MDKTVNINLGGSLFQMDEEAYHLLNDYINGINARFRYTEGGPETIEDIEYRIAEIFRSKKGIGVVSRDTVEYMISVIGKPGEIGADDQELPDNNIMPGNTRRLYRNPDDKVIGGVSGGLGAYLNVDPVLFRVLFVLFTFVGGAGLLIYLVMWIAVPSANTEAAKMELYGNDYARRRVHHANGSNNGAHEIISMTGKAFYIIFRIVLIFFGTVLVLTGFTLIMTYIIVFILNYPGAFHSQGFDYSINYLQMLEYMLSPASSRWMLFLISMVIILPLVALVYWGTKMIFWFNSRDAYINLTGFILWIVSLTALTIMFFSEGVSFAETSSSTTNNILTHTPDTLYISTTGNMEDIDYDQKFILDHYPRLYFLADSAGNKYLNPTFRFVTSDNKEGSIEIRKQSSGKTKKEAARKAESIDYNYSLDNDTIHLDEYFILQPERKWAGDFVKIKFSLPENTVIHVDEELMEFMGIWHNNYGDQDSGFWVYSDGRLKRSE